MLSIAFWSCMSAVVEGFVQLPAARAALHTASTPVKKSGLSMNAASADAWGLIFDCDGVILEV
jgi:hypothetical protein